jgi:hypothetical protein
MAGISKQGHDRADSYVDEQEKWMGDEIVADGTMNGCHEDSSRPAS